VSFQAVVLAGGKGTRLQPLTHVLPKPLLPIDERPIIDVVLSCLARDGCDRATLAVGHLGHMIELYCGSGERWGLELEYFRERTPLGTVGALAQIQPFPTGPFIVINGDVLSDVSFTDLLRSHASSDAELTIATARRTVREELGVLERDASNRLTAYHEKPEHEYLVSMGVYVMDPAVIDLIEPGRAMDFPALVQALLRSGRAVNSASHDGFWLDLGRPDDFARANAEFGRLRPRLGM
jgi:NDP-mannose synthase